MHTLEVWSHVAKNVSACFTVLCQLWGVRRSLSRSVLQSLMSSLILSRLDYGNVTLDGIASYLLQQLQSVMNSAARLVFSSSRYDHKTPVLQQLHGWEFWRGFSSSLLFLCISVCMGQHRRISPTSLSTRLISGPGDAFVPFPHWCWMSVVHGCPLSGIGPSLLLLPALGTVCPNVSRLLCLFSEVASRPFSSGIHLHDFYRNFCSARAATIVIFRHTF